MNYKNNISFSLPIVCIWLYNSFSVHLLISDRLISSLDHNNNNKCVLLMKRKRMRNVCDAFYVFGRRLTNVMPDKIYTRFCCVVFCCFVAIPSTLFNSLWPSDTMWRHRSGSTLVQVMACCPTASSHYLHQCWLIVSKVYWHSYEGNFARDTLTINHVN